MSEEEHSTLWEYLIRIARTGHARGIWTVPPVSEFATQPMGGDTQHP